MNNAQQERQLESVGTLDAKARILEQKLALEVEICAEWRAEAEMLQEMLNAANTEISYLRKELAEAGY